VRARNAQQPRQLLQAATVAAPISAVSSFRLARHAGGGCTPLN
jgi:hypothetical protein